MKGRKNKEIVEYSSGEMVTIDEILKNDPKALSELTMLRKWMNENPTLFDFPSEKQTQGQKKMKQLLEDARRDTDFVKQIKKIVKEKPTYKPEDIERLYTFYLLFLAGLESFRVKFFSKNRAHKIKQELCKEYGIDPILFDRLVSAYKNNQMEGWDFNEETSSDVCIIESQEDIDRPVDIHSFHVGLVDGIQKDIYPINLKIHRFSSKRDILDFVENKWKDISPYLSEKRIKQRKVSREVTDFVWKNRDKKAKEIASLLKTKYPKQNLLYFEINKILNEEKKRRKIK